MILTILKGEMEVKISYPVVVETISMKLHCVDYKNSVVIHHEKGRLFIDGLLPADLKITVRKRTLWDLICRR
jgi:hypothetical protein